jgi:cytochrome c-type protein NapB
MQGTKKHLLGIVSLATLLLLCGEPQQPVVGDGLDVYFRGAELNAMSAQDLEVYGDAEAGESKPLERAFPGAPPQIPHTIQGMLPLAADSNECIDCHHPENVTDLSEKPIPDSHFQVARLTEGLETEPMRWKVKGYEKGDELAGSRFNCTMCHTPQAVNVKTPKSTFLRMTEPASR